MSMEDYNFQQARKYWGDANPPVTPAPKREWVDLTDADIDEIKQNSPVYVSAKAVSAIVPMVEAKLKEKNT
jgi:hypothetical protein